MLKINELQVGSDCEITLVVKAATGRETRYGKPYLSLELFDGVDTINANYWNWSSGKVPNANSILDVHAKVTEWQSNKQLTVTSLTLNTKMSLEDFKPASTNDLSTIYKDAYAMASDIHNNVLRDVTLWALEYFADEWFSVPGAKSIHHAYAGGTLVHSLSVARIAAAIADTIPEANKDLCVAGALLHDLGKLRTYVVDGVNIDCTGNGLLHDHIVIGYEIVGTYMRNTVDADDIASYRVLDLLRHIILSHHGRLEYGSPVVPKCLEAHIVHMADMLDARTEQIRAADAKLADTYSLWTERLYGIGTSQIRPSAVKEAMAESNESFGK